MLTSTPETPAGVRIRFLQANRDERGVFLEVFRDEWDTACEPVQWSVINSEAGVLRGVHVHVTHTDYLIVVTGVMLLGLHDLRPRGGNGVTSCMLTLDARQPIAVTIPPGVCHGFFYPTPTTHVYAVTHYWDPTNELGCRFDAPELDLAWPATTPILSERDRTAPSYSQMRDDFLAQWRRGDPDKSAKHAALRL